MRCRRCSHELSSGADRCLRCFALNPQNVEGPLFAGLDSDPPKELRVRFDDEPGPRAPPPPLEKTPAPSPKARNPAARRPPQPAPLLFLDMAKTPAPPPRPEPVAAAPPEQSEPARAPRRFHLKTFLFAWAIDFGAVAALTVLHAALAAAVIGPERLAPGRTGSVDYWFDLFRGGGLWALWLALAATLGLDYSAFSAMLHVQNPGLALATLRVRESRLPPERSAP
jgi:hypothetical protein